MWLWGRARLWKRFDGLSWVCGNGAVCSDGGGRRVEECMCGCGCVDAVVWMRLCGGNGLAGMAIKVRWGTHCAGKLGMEGCVDVSLAVVYDEQ